MKFSKDVAEKINQGMLKGNILRNGKSIYIRTTPNCNKIVGYEKIDGVDTPFIFDADNCPEITIKTQEVPTFNKGDVVVTASEDIIVISHYTNPTTVVSAVSIDPDEPEYDCFTDTETWSVFALKRKADISQINLVKDRINDHLKRLNKIQKSI